MEKPWLEHYDGGVPETIDYPDITVDQFLTQAAVKHPNQTVTIFGARVGPLLMDAKLTYQRLNDAVNRFADEAQRLAVSGGGLR